MGSFDNAQSLKINNKYVRKITDSDNGVLFEANTQNVSRKFAKDVSGGSSVTLAIEDAASIKNIKGNTIAWNQEIVDGNFPTVNNWTTVGSSLSVSDGIATVTITGTAVTAEIRQGVALAEGHKYLFSCDIRYTNGSSSSFAVYNGTISSSVQRLGAVGSEWSRKSTIVTSGGSASSATLQLRCNQDGGTVGDICQIKNVMFIDLTIVFGAGNEPTTVEEFRAMFPNEYYAYSEPTLLSFVGNGIKSYDSSKNVVGSCTIPTSTYFADGMKSAGTVYDELLPNKAIKRIGTVDLGTLTWGIDTAKENLFRSNISDRKTGRNIDAYCAKYKCIKGDRFPFNGEIGFVPYRSITNVFIKDTLYTTAEELKESLSGVMLYYELAEPVETPINPPIDLSYVVQSGGTEEVESTELSSPIDANIEYVIT